MIDDSSSVAEGGLGGGSGVERSLLCSAMISERSVK